MTRQSFLRGSLILIVAGLLTRILGMINRIVLSRVIGDEGVGLFMMAYPTMLLTVTLTQMGLPVAISKMVAEADALGDRRKIKRVLVVSFAIVGVLSVTLTAVMVVLTPLMAKTVFTDPRTVYPLIAIAPIIPIVAISSVLRGYFQGMRHMKPYAYSEVIEQIIRISLVAFLANSLLPFGIEYAAAGAMISGVLGELASLIYMLYMFKKGKRIKVRTEFLKNLQQGKSTARQLLAVALPTMGSRLIGSLSNFFEPIVISQSLAIAGVATVISTKQYGELSGYAIPLLILPSFITHALHVSLVPAVSEAHARKMESLIHFRLNQALKIAMLTGGLSIIVTYSFAEPIMTLMYHSPSSAKYVYVMAPFFSFFYFQGPLQAVLQALDLAKAAMINTLIGAVVKILTIWALASRPEFGMIGAALGIVVNVVLVTLLHWATVIKTIGFSLVVKDYFKIAVIILASGVLAHFLNKRVLLDWELFPRTAALIGIVALFYISLTLFLRLIKKEELKRIPIIGKWLN
ncbi:stage V sporulation protein B [Terrilactibacillus sp. S3-3]|nr:stage V sporulation protein B [Terrilactibacillus sp. S3-3]